MKCQNFIYFVLITKTLLMNDIQYILGAALSHNYSQPECLSIGGKFHVLCSIDAIPLETREKCIYSPHGEQKVSKVSLLISNSISGLFLFYQQDGNTDSHYPHGNELIVDFGYNDEVSILVQLKNNLTKNWNGTHFICIVESHLGQKYISQAKLITSGGDCSFMLLSVYGNCSTARPPSNCIAQDTTNITTAWKWIPTIFAFVILSNINAHTVLVLIIIYKNKEKKTKCPSKHVRFDKRLSIIPRSPESTSELNFLDILGFLQYEKNLSAASSGGSSLSSNVDETLNV